MKCPTCNDQRMIPSDDPDGDVMNTPCPQCNEHSKSYDKAAHDKAWEKHFVTPIGREMKKRGIAYMVLILRNDGKLAYVLDKEIPGDIAGPWTPTPKSDSKQKAVANDGLLGVARPKSRLPDGRMNPEWVALRKAERGGVAASTAWARAHPEAHRERCREATKRFRQTPKGEVAKKKRSEKRKVGLLLDEAQCIRCGRIENRVETKLQEWVMTRKLGTHKGVCNECA